MRAADTPCMCDAGAQLLIASRKAKAKQLAAHDACQSPILISSTPSHVCSEQWVSRLARTQLPTTSAVTTAAVPFVCEGSWHRAQWQDHDPNASRMAVVTLSSASLWYCSYMLAGGLGTEAAGVSVPPPRSPGRRQTSITSPFLTVTRLSPSHAGLPELTVGVLANLSDRLYAPARTSLTFCACCSQASMRSLKTALFPVFWEPLAA